MGAQVEEQDVRWVVHPLGRYSNDYAYMQYRALQQFFKWLAAEEDIADPMAGAAPAEGDGEAGAIFHQR